jgi:chromosome segregation ATPase
LTFGLIENGEQLEATIAEYEAIIGNHDNEANEAIALWEERCNALNDQIAELEYEHAQNENSLRTDAENLEVKLSAKDKEYNDIIEKMNQLSTVIEEITKEKENILNELANVQQSLQYEILKQNEQSLVVKELTEEKAAAFGRFRNDELEYVHLCESLENEKTLNQKLESKLSSTEEMLKEANNKLQQIEQDKFDVEQYYEENMRESKSRIQILEEERKFLEESNEIDRAEANEMRLIIGQLENELREANDALQAHLTDEVTARATEMATNALREQLKQSRETQCVEHEAYLSEKEGRLAAEQEVENLQSDLALLLEVDKHSESHESRMQQLTSKAAGQVLERQRGEINALTKSVDELMQELQRCQSKEREAEERAANSRLHASSCEQELLGAKSDISLLKESITLLKRDENELRNTLENRVKSLEDERDTLMLSYTNDVKNLKIEISQGQIERDRLVHALNESEKANSALVYSTSVDQGCKNSPLELEIAKLRLEKAQLLAEVQENGSKVEQRIRSAVSGENEKYNNQTDRSLIIAAEKSLKTLQQKYDETSAQLKLANESNTDLLSRIKETNISTLKNDLYRFETEVEKLRQANEDLKLQLKESKQEAVIANSTLEEKCRLAEAKIIDLERQERKEAALAAELARVRDEANALKSVIPPVESIGETKEAITGDSLHDFVAELTQTVQEERKMYQDLLVEHEDLLALLAQQDLEVTSLQSALIHSVGEEAVEKAILHAEAQAVQQFGKYIRLR